MAEPMKLNFSTVPTQKYQKIYSFKRQWLYIIQDSGRHSNEFCHDVIYSVKKSILHKAES